MEEYEDDGTWIWISLASECRMVLAHVIGERKQYVADRLIGLTKERLASIPLYVTDGLKFYSEAFLKHYARIVRFPSTGKRGRPKKPQLIPDVELKYAQVIKLRSNGHLSKVVKKVVFGRDIHSNLISTSLIERQNLTFRQDNNRLSRKTLGFSKKIKNLMDQMTLYFAEFNFCRGHGSLKYLDDRGFVKKNCPAESMV